MEPVEGTAGTGRSLTTSCRLCGRTLLDPPALTLERVPAGAQAFLPHPRAATDGATVDLVLRECEACGLLQLDNEPVPYFREVITASAVSPAIVAARQEQLREWVDAHGLRGRRVLEVGCGRGHLLDVLSGLGVEAWGLEAGPSSVEAARQEGRRVVAGYPGEPVPSIDPFDGFLCFNFLEHAPRVGVFLDGIHELLREGAAGIVEVPNFEKDIAIRRHYDLIVDHLSYFTGATLSRALGAHGFDVLELGTCWEGDSLRAVVRKRIPACYEEWKESNPVLSRMNEVLSDPAFGRVAVWGASHEALTLLSMVNSLPVCILDSAPFKQNRFEPSRGLPILPPADLAAQRIDTVIVLAAIYSAEIVETLVGRMGFSGNVLRVVDGRLELVRGMQREPREP